VRSRIGWLVVAFWTLFGVVCGMQLFLSMLSHHHSLPRVLIYQVLVWWAWIAVSFGVARLLRLLPLVPARTRNYLAHLLIAIVIGIAHAAWWVLLILLVEPFDRLNPTGFWRPFVQIAAFQLPLELLLYGLVALAAHVGLQAARERDRERLLAEARLQALELQLQPHFVFNTLNAVSALVRTDDNRRALTMIAGLADLLRYALDRSGRPRVALSEEIDMVRRYLEIEQLRFADRLSFTIEATAEVGRAAVPSLLLQPLAENAIRHGVAPSPGPGEVRLRAYRRDQTLCVEVWNTGWLRADARPGIGLGNTRSRLAALYGDAQRCELGSADDGVLARVTLPWSEVD
jgi:two-component system, LytTR family, sensor kinase